VASASVIAGTNMPSALAQRAELAQLELAPSRYAMRDKGRKLPPSSSALLVGWGAVVLAVSGSVIGRGMRSGR
jgi:hypothetical protein